MQDSYHQQYFGLFGAPRKLLNAMSYCIIIRERRQLHFSKLTWKWTRATFRTTNRSPKNEHPQPLIINVYVYKYIYIYTCMYICIFVYIYIHERLYIRGPCLLFGGCSLLLGGGIGSCQWYTVAIRVSTDCSLSLPHK